MTQAASILPDDFGDRWNPLLVKELRQSLRSRNFVGLFLVAQLVSAIVAATVITNVDDNTGTSLLIALGVCLVVTTMGFVPLFAFQAFAQEWDENTHELLVLSQLGPGRIAWGKFQGALLQTVLVVVSFAPYLALCLFLEGVDALLLGLIVASVVIGSGAASCLAISIAGVSHNRNLRNALLALVAVGLIGVCIGSIAALAGGALTPSVLRTPEFWSIYGGVALFVLCAALLCFLGARAHVAHPEEAPTFPARVAAVLVALAVPVLIFALVVAPIGIGPGASIVAIGLFVGLIPALVLFATERERLGRVAARRLRGRGVLAAAIHPLLPGGGRGLLLIPLVAAVVWGSAWAGERIAVASGAFVDVPTGASMRYLVIVLYTWLFVGVASLVTWRLGEREAWRWVARLGVPVLIAVCAVGGILIGALIGDRSMANGNHALNVPDVLTSSDRRVLEALPVLGVLAALLLLANLPRWWRGYRDVQRQAAGR